MSNSQPRWGDNDGVSALRVLSDALDHLATVAPSRAADEPAAPINTQAAPLQNLPAHLVFARHWESHKHEFLPRMIDRPCPLCAGSRRQKWFDTQDGYRYDVCKSCGMVHIPAVLPLTVWDDYYSSLPHARDFLREQLLGSTTDAAWARDQERFTRYLQLLRLHGLSSGQRLLDVGSWTGAWVRVAAEAGLVASGIEGLTEAVAIARERFPAVPIAHGRVEEFDPSTLGGTVDALTMWETLEHTLDPMAALRRAAGALRPGGLLAVSVPNAINPQFTLLGSYCFYAYGGYHYTGHINMFSPATLRLALDRAGFTVEHLGSEFGTDWRQVLHYVRHEFDRIHCYRNLIERGDVIPEPGPEMSVLLGWLSPALTRLENACVAGPILIALARRR